MQGGYKAGRLSSGFVQEQEEKIVQIERELTECERQEEEIEAEIESGKVTESTPDQITRLSAKIEELSLEASRIFSVIMD